MIAAALGALLPLSSPSVLSSPSSCVMSALEKVYLNATCMTQPHSKPGIDMAGMKGERESVQLILQPPVGSLLTVKPVFSDLKQESGDTILSSSFRWLEVGYVNAQHTTRYSPSGGGWTPDPLMPSSHTLRLRSDGGVSVVWLTVDIPREAAPGEYQGTANFTTPNLTFSFDVKLQVWDLALPAVSQLQVDFKEIWSFNTHNLQTFYGSNFTNGTKTAFFDMMTDHLLPPDDLYKSSPAPMKDYLYLNRTGAALLNLGAIGRDARGCPTPYTDAQIQKVLDGLAPTVKQLDQLGVLNNHVAYVYGYDEQPQSCERNIRDLFGAVKQAFPKISTAAVLNWPGGLPPDLPVDIWIVQYEDYNATNRAAWKAAGKAQFWYHCIEPSGAQFLNTFIERPWVQARLLYWLAAANEVDGWLYYATDIWRARPGTKHTPIMRLENTTSDANTGAMTDFPPANYIWTPRTDIFANGDGQFVYPGPAGEPVGTARLANIRDAVEDMALLRLARKTKIQNLDACIARLVRSPTDHTDDPQLFEETRRNIAKAIYTGVTDC